MNDRAVQFGAFAALTGYYDIIERGSEISVCHFTENGYVSAAGIVSDINFEKRFMIIGDKKILFDDIYEIN